MKIAYITAEKGFEKFTSAVSVIMGNSVTFIIALCVVVFWLSSAIFSQQDIHYSIGDMILGFTFLSLFIIQKSFNHFSASIQLKLNELVASHEPASNQLINVEEKTEHELNKLTEGYSEMAAVANVADKKNEDDSAK